MPFRTIPGSDTRYALLAVDRRGHERTDDPDGRYGRMSEKLVEMLVNESITNIFFYSHGWKGDIPAAIDQYNRWIGAVERRQDDRKRMTEKFPKYKPLHVGLHWPSEPWGEEELQPNDVSFDAHLAVEELVETYIERLDDTPKIRQALTTIFEDARSHPDADQLSTGVRKAYIDLNHELGLSAVGVGGDSGSDRAEFNPDQGMKDANTDIPDFGGQNLGGILAPLRLLSFWMMKSRAQTVGESGMHTLLKRVQKAAPSARIHLMGHSFGCIIVSAMAGGPQASAPLERPVDSCVMVQGAMSLWAYCSDIPFQPGTPGYFHRIVGDKKVRGPIVTTQSAHDRAVRILYPLAAGAANQVIFAGENPEFGGVGMFGLQGVTGTEDRKMLPTNQNYDFEPGKIFNLESSQYIRKGDGVSGAHSDIDGPEVAHTIWQAAFGV